MSLQSCVTLIIQASKYFRKSNCISFISSCVFFVRHLTQGVHFCSHDDRREHWSLQSPTRATKKLNCCSPGSLFTSRRVRVRVRPRPLLLVGLAGGLEFLRLRVLDLDVATEFTGLRLLVGVELGELGLRLRLLVVSGLGFLFAVRGVPALRGVLAVRDLFLCLLLTRIFSFVTLFSVSFSDEGGSLHPCSLWTWWTAERKSNKGESDARNIQLAHSIVVNSGHRSIQPFSNPSNSSASSSPPSAKSTGNWPEKAAISNKTKDCVPMIFIAESVLSLVLERYSNTVYSKIFCCSCLAWHTPFLVHLHSN